MVTGIIGKKVGMTQLFEADGTAASGDGAQGRPVRRGAGEDGWRPTATSRCSSGSSRSSRPRRTADARPLREAGVPATRVRREVAVKEGGDPVKPGDQVNVSMFTTGIALTSSARAAARAFRVSSSGTISAAAAPRTARCSIARPD